MNWILSILLFSSPPALAAPSVTAERLGPVHINKPLPSFGGFDLDGKPISNSSIYGEHRVVIISYFATWCAPCTKNLPILERIIQSNEDVQGLYIAIGEKEEATIRDYAKNLGLDTAIVWDKYRRISERHGVSDGGNIAIPITFIMDRKGRVRVIFTEEGDDFEKRVSKIIRSL